MVFFESIYLFNEITVDLLFLQVAPSQPASHFSSGHLPDTASHD